MSIDQIGFSGNRAADISLRNTAHSIANTETPWFTRMQPVLVAERTHWGDELQQPGGVKVKQLLRLSSNFLNHQVFDASASKARADVIANTMNTVDKLLSNEYTGMASVISDFTGDLQRLEVQPQSMPLREQWLGTTKRLATRLHSLGHQFTVLLAHRNERIDSLVATTNQLSEDIATLNRRIAELIGGVDQQSQSSDLLDHRDNLINQLAQKIGVDVVYHADSSVSLSILTDHGNLPIVAKHQHWPLANASESGNPFSTKVILKATGVDMEVSALDGELAGLQQMDQQGLLNILNQLGWQSVLLAGHTNQQLANGEDLQGAKGAALFSDINNNAAQSQRAIPERVTGNGKLSVEISALDDLKPSDYRLIFTKAAADSGEYQITRLSDGQIIRGDFDVTNSLSFDGLTVHVDGEINPKDQYLLTPWRHEPENLSLVMHDSTLLGFANQNAGPGDNRNLQKLLAKLKGNGDSDINLQERYIRLQSIIANQTASAQALKKTSDAVYQSAMNERESLSGVNMDDEAANLVRLHQFYQANVRLLQVNRSIIDDLLSILP